MSESQLSLIFFTLLAVSIRWGLVIAFLWVGLRFIRPISVQARWLLCQIVVVGGLLFFVVPIFWGPVSVRPVQETQAFGNTSGGISDRQVSFAKTQDGTPTPILASSMPADRIEPLPSHSPSSGAKPAVAAIPSSSPRALAGHVPSGGIDVGTVPENIPAVSSSINYGTWCIRLLVLAWFAGVFLSVLRLVAGWCWLVRLRRTSSPASVAAIDLLDQCCNDLQRSLAVTLLMNPRVYVPALIGYRHPTILLPENWDQLPLISRRSALLHELTHLANRDHWAKLVDECVRALFFFHPLVRWPLTCLDGAREERCDASVVNHGTTPHDLARVLLEFAKQQQTAPRPGQWGLASTFLKRVTVKDRIHDLLEDDFMRRTKPLSRAWNFALVFTLVALLAGVGGFGLRTEAAQEKTVGGTTQDKPTKNTDVANDKQIKEGALEHLVNGTGVDESGHPVADASVLLHRTMGDAKPIVTRTDAEGKFRFESLPGDKENGFVLKLVAVRSGYAPAEGYAVGEKPLKLSTRETSIEQAGSCDRHSKRPQRECDCECSRGTGNR